jgi:hypothetical protein
MNGFECLGKPLNVRKVADFPEALTLDGMTTVNVDQGIMMISDTTLGVVWKLNEVINLPSLKSLPGVLPTLGVNGINYHNDYLYYTSTDQQLYDRIPMSSEGVVVGEAESIAHLSDTLDDFTIDGIGNGLLTVNSTSISLVQPHGRNFLLSGGSGSAALPGVTCARFGRTLSDAQTLYIGTVGGSFNGSISFTQPASIMKIAVGAAGYYDYV